MMFYVLNAICSDYALAGILGVIKRVIDVIRIVVPILLLIGGTIIFVKGIFNPDQSDKTKKAFVNSIISAVIVILLPFIINTTMAIISAYGDVGIVESESNLAFDISSCWEYAGVSVSEMDSTYDDTSLSIEDEKTKQTSSGQSKNNSSTSNKNSNSNSNTNSSSGNKSNSDKNSSSNSNQTNNTKSSYNKYILVGDSRFVGQKSSGQTDSKTTYIAKSSQGLSYLKEQAEAMKKQDSKNTAFVINMGVNDLYNASNYVSYINDLAKSYKGSIYYLSVNPVDENKEKQNGYSVKNKDIESFNKTLKNGLKNVTYLDSYSYLQKKGFSTSDGVHYTNQTYKDIYNFIKNNIK